MTVITRPRAAAIDGLQDVLLANALADELEGFSAEDQAEAASFISDVAAQRRPGELAIRLESTGGEAGRRRMRLAIAEGRFTEFRDSFYRQQPQEQGGLTCAETDGALQGE